MRPARSLLLVLLGLLWAGAALANPLESWRGIHVSRIELQGNQVTKDYVIEREIWSRAGQPLDPDLVQADIIRLQNLSIFGAVEVVVTPEEDGVVLNYRFREMPWLLPLPAISWNEQNGFSGGAGLSSPNFMGHGVKVSAKALFGGTTNYFLRISNPWLAGDHLSLDFLASHVKRPNEVLEFEETAEWLEVNAGYYLSTNGRLGANVGYRTETSDRDGITLDPNRTDNLVYGGLSLGYDSRNSWRAPHSGWRLKLSGTWLGGDANSWNTTADVRRFQPLAERHTLAFGPLASVQTGEVGVDLPSYQQYFLGGSNSVRGYKLDVLGREVFGKNRLLFSTEYRYLALPVRAVPVLKWAVPLGVELASFVDLGVVWSEPSEFGVHDGRLGYGVGARLLVPVVDMLRFDVGVSDTGDVVFNFGVWSMFEARTLPTF